jgi:hypothetical protein
VEIADDVRDEMRLERVEVQHADFIRFDDVHFERIRPGWRGDEQGRGHHDRSKEPPPAGRQAEAPEKPNAPNG